MAAPLAPAEDLLIRTPGRVVPAGREFAFDVVAADTPIAQLADARLDFPGFVPAADPIPLPAGGLRWQGRLTRPGFHALTARATVAGRALCGRDYFTVAESPPGPALHEAGYYVFLGCGDYPIITGQETHPLASWSREQWLDLVTWMGGHGLNRLWVLLNGYTLAYPSRRYPELRDRFARNVTDNFLGDVIAHAHRCGVKVFLMLTTDGHGRDFSVAHPEAVRRDATGGPGPHHGLALEHPATRRYLFDVLEEVLELYPAADGIAIHPTESDPDRLNEEPLAPYRTETGRDLRAEPADVRRVWHNRAFARFLAEYSDHAQRLRPGLEWIMANCWWLDDHISTYLAELPLHFRVAVWHYAWEESAATPWTIHRWVAALGPERVIYLPTSQSYLYPTDPRRVMDRHIGTDRLVSTAAGLGVRNTLYFAGWDILPEDARLLDAALVRHPTSDLFGAPDRGLPARLYADYLGTRAAGMRPAS